MVTQTLPSRAPVAAANSGTFQVGYLTSTTRGESYINLTNTGALSGNDVAGQLCVNVYAFDP